MPIQPPIVQPTRQYVARFYKNTSLTITPSLTPLFRIEKAEGFRGPLEYELNYKNILLPFGGAILSGNGVAIPKDLEIDFEVHVGNILIDVVGVALSSSYVSSVNNIEWLLAQCNYIEYQNKKYTGLVFQRASPADVNSYAKSSIITARFLADDVFTFAPVEWATAPTLPVATVQTTYTTQLTATSDAIGAITYTKVSGYTPITVSTTGLITWPYVYTALPQNITVRATDTNGNSVDRTFTIPTTGGMYPSFWPSQYPLR